MQCSEVVKKYLDHKKISEIELMAAARELRRMVRNARAGKAAADRSKLVEELSKQWSGRHKAAIEARRRNVFLQAHARMNNVNFALTEFEGKEAAGISALLTGSRYLREGARRSVDNLFGGLQAEYIGGISTSIEKLGVAELKLWQSGKMDEHLADALFLVEHQDQYQGPAEAMRIAEVIHEFQERARIRANQNGAYIQKIDGYIAEQTHDQLRIEKAGFDQWRKDIEPRLDWENTADGKFLETGTPEADEARTKFLTAVWKNLVTGYHKKTSYNLPLDIQKAMKDPLIQPGNIGSTASKLSRHRILRFNSGKSWHEYNQKYGSKSLAQAVVSDLEKLARDTALMRVFGPSPQENLALIINDVTAALQDKGDIKGVRRMEKSHKHLNDRMKALDGTLNIDGNPTIAAVFGFVRAIQSMAKLGMATISGLSDIPTLAFELKYQGYGYWSSFGRLLSGFWGKGSLAQRETLAACGVFYDSMKGAINGRFNGDVGPGVMNRLMYHYFRLNGLSMWTDWWKKSFCLTMSNGLAGHAEKSWGALNSQTRRLLSLYRIDEGKWEMLRKGQMKAADERMYFTAELAEQLDRADVAAYMQSQGMLASDARVAKFRDDLAGDIRAMFRDRTRYAMLEPDAETSALLTLGTSSGTWLGETVRSIFQFKQFPALYLQRTWARELYGRGAANWKEAVKGIVVPRNRELSCLTGILLATTVFGYLSMTTKEFLAGKKPREWDSPEQIWKIFVASALQGGGAGIYGDFLFGGNSRFGNSFLATLGGPGSVRDLQQKERPWHNGFVSKQPTQEGSHGQAEVYRIGRRGKGIIGPGVRLFKSDNNEAGAGSSCGRDGRGIAGSQERAQ